MTEAKVTSNPEIMGGTPEFAGTRVPVRIPFEHLEAGDDGPEGAIAKGICRMFTPETFVTTCRDCVSGGGSAKQIEVLVREALQDQAREPLLWQGEELMYRSPKLTIINLTLPGLGKSAVHDHGMWAVIGISAGCEIERFYSSGPEGLVQIGRVEVHDGQTVCLASDVIHDIENPNIQAARGLHVYGGDLTTVARRMWHPRTRSELAFHFPTFEQWEEELSAGGKPTHPSGGQP